MPFTSSSYFVTTADPSSATSPPTENAASDTVTARSTNSPLLQSSSSQPSSALLPPRLLQARVTFVALVAKFLVHPVRTLYGRLHPLPLLLSPLSTALTTGVVDKRSAAPAYGSYRSYNELLYRHGAPCGPAQRACGGCSGSGLPW